MSKVNLFDDALYTAGSRVPEGNYALEFLVCMHAGENKQTGQPFGPPRLGVMVTFYPINETGQLIGEAIQKHYGMGTNAHESFAPDPETGKTVVPVPGGKFSTLMGSTNWSLLRKSLKDCDPAVASLGDLSEMDGVWAHIQNVPEPAERKDFGAKTGEAAAQQGDQPKGSGTVPVVSEILEGGKPWEGGGGLPTEEAPKAAAKPAPKAVVGKPGAKAPVKPAVTAAKPGAKAPAKAAAAPVQEADEDAGALAISLIGAQLEKVMDAEGNFLGLKRLKLRTEVFKAAGANANAVMEAGFKDDDTLSGMLNALGYKVEGNEILPQ